MLPPFRLPLGVLLAAVTLLTGSARLPAQESAAPQGVTPGRYNVLFIAVDDLRPQFGAYGDPVVKSPNLDRIARRGVTFTRAYCQQAVCSPSRSSLLTGRRPDTTKVWDLVTHFRTAIPDVVTLPQHFKNHGYHSQSFGKIYHPGYDDPASWSVPPTRQRGAAWGPDGQTILRDRRAMMLAAGRNLNQPQSRAYGPAWEAPEVPDEFLNDGTIATDAIEALQARKDAKEPFFLAVGFLKPHLPFVAPKKYWDLYRPEEIPLATNPYPSRGAPAYAWQNAGELRQYPGIPSNGPLPKEMARKLIHGYYAAISYMDAQLGRILDELDRQGLTEKTVIVLWGDHGWHLGEHGTWCKHTNYEVATRAPLLMSVPGLKSAGRKSAGLVEFVDIYPTLADVCGLPRPDGVEGGSFKPLMDDPGILWKRAAFHQYPRAIPGQGAGMGYAIRTDRYRLVEWRVPGKDFRQHELYDLLTDPDENQNLANQPEHAATVRRLTEQLQAGWRASAAPR